MNASASTAGELFSSSTFEIPEFQREYSWGKDEVDEFFSDLRNNLGSESYFMGLIILTNNKPRRFVIDGQQRLITISLLASALYRESIRLGRSSLAERIRSSFMQTLDYETDEKVSRISLADDEDNTTFQYLINAGSVADIDDNVESVSKNMRASYALVNRLLKADLRHDPFKRLGKWTEFLTNHVYFAVFVHSDLSTAYQVYEVINTRGKDLTTADLLKNYVLYQTAENQRSARYEHWKSISSQFVSDGNNNFVQYIRHAVTVGSGHILPKELYAFLSAKQDGRKELPPGPDELMSILDRHLPLYLQMIDPTKSGPASPEALEIFTALNQLNVIAVRPILLAMAGLPDELEGMRYVLQLVVRRIVVGNLGTGNVERRLGDSAKLVHDSGSWESVISELRDLNPQRDEFVDQLSRRPLNKSVLTFMRRSIVRRSMTPEHEGVLHFVASPSGGWPSMSEEDIAYWASTIGNTILLNVDKRPAGSDDWDGFKENALPAAIASERADLLRERAEWNAKAIAEVGRDLALAGASVWYNQS